MDLEEKLAADWVFENTLKHIGREDIKVRFVNVLTAGLSSDNRWMPQKQEGETPIISRFFPFEYSSEPNFQLYLHSTPLNAFAVFVDCNNPSVHVNREQQEIVTIKSPFFKHFLTAEWWMD